MRVSTISKTVVGFIFLSFKITMVCGMGLCGLESSKIFQAFNNLLSESDFFIGCDLQKSSYHSYNVDDSILSVVFPGMDSIFFFFFLLHFYSPSHLKGMKFEVLRVFEWYGNSNLIILDFRVAKYVARSCSNLGITVDTVAPPG